jgi:hypothetical protein
MLELLAAERGVDLLRLGLFDIRGRLRRRRNQRGQHLLGGGGRAGDEGEQERHDFMVPECAIRQAGIGRRVTDRMPGRRGRQADFLHV